jgi:hypothetical protein
VKAIHAATNLALGFTRKMKTPLMIIPRPITRIPPTPVRRKIKHNHKNFIVVANASPVMVLPSFLVSSRVV